MTDAGTLTALAPGDGVYLIVGSDSRANLPDDLGGNFGDFPGARADVIILAQVANGRRQLLSIPRDLKVELPGHGTEKINAAYSLGGPDLLVEAVALPPGSGPITTWRSSSVDLRPSSTPSAGSSSTSLFRPAISSRAWR